MPAGNSTESANALAALQVQLVRSHNPPDGLRHRQTTFREPALSPRAGTSFGPPTHPY